MLEESTKKDIKRRIKQYELDETTSLSLSEIVNTALELLLGEDIDQERVDVLAEVLDIEAVKTGKTNEKGHLFYGKNHGGLSDVRGVLVRMEDD